jgi:hypothetical protein
VVETSNVGVGTTCGVGLAPVFATGEELQAVPTASAATVTTAHKMDRIMPL